MSFSSKQKTSPANDHSKYSFYQTGARGAQRSPGAVESPETPAESRPKRSRTSLDEKTTSRKSLPERYVTGKGCFIRPSDGILLLLINSM